MSKVSKASVAAAVSVALLAGACTPQARPVAFIGGSMLTVVGGVSVLDLKYGDPDLETGLAEIFYGIPALIVGTGILLAAIASSDAPAAPAETGALAPAAPVPPAPVLLPVSPSPSPSAPSGSPLAPAQPSQSQARSLSMRAGSALAFH